MKTGIAYLSKVFLFVTTSTSIGLILGWWLTLATTGPITPTSPPASDMVALQRPGNVIGATRCVDPSEPASSPNDHPLLPAFRGDTLWIHNREGHEGSPYWPSGASGITLDPGIDLGHVEPWLVDTAYGHRLSHAQRTAIDEVMGIQGKRAQLSLRRSSTLRSIRISRTTAAEVFPYLLKPYWKSLRRRFPPIERATVPSPVQTALLSLAYNRGPWNPELARLRAPLQSEDWQALAKHIRDMQQDHPLEGIRRRRRIESKLISQSLQRSSPKINCPAIPSRMNIEDLAP